MENIRLHLESGATTSQVEPAYRQLSNWVLNICGITSTPEVHTRIMHGLRNYSWFIPPAIEHMDARKLSREDSRTLLRLQEDIRALQDRGTAFIKKIEPETIKGHVIRDKLVAVQRVKAQEAANRAALERLAAATRRTT